MTETLKPKRMSEIDKARVLEIIKMAEGTHKDFAGLVFKLRCHFMCDDVPPTAVNTGKRKDGHPMQPIYIDDLGTARFKPNKIVRYLLDHGGLDMNKLSCVFPRDLDEHQHFAQLIGYSVSGFADLPEAPEYVIERADAIVDAMLADQNED